MLYRQTWAEVNLDAIYHNVHSFVKYVSPEQEVLAAVKADGYGHGAVQVAEEAIKAGATWLGVALLEEAIELREAGQKAPILLMGYLSAEHIPIAQQYGVSVTVTDEEHFQQVVNALDSAAPPLRIHLKIDTGMGRLGILTDEALERLIDDYVRQVQTNHPTLIWEGVYTHLATADEEKEDYLHQQLEKMKQKLTLLKQYGIKVPYIHLANSAGTLKKVTSSFSNLVRVGISMYGLAPSPYMKERLPFPLQPAFSLHSRFSFVKQVPSPLGISYGSTYVAQKGEWVGTIPIGYADGFSRPLSNRVQVLVRGQRMDVIGNICMDQTMIGLDQPYPVDEKVTLIGRQGEEMVTADEWASLLGTINYEIPCMITKRVPRVYTRNKNGSGSDNYT